jgi:hypothetical protein
MKKQKTTPTPQRTESLMDFFPMPRTIPHGWDCSEMLNSTKSAEKKNTEANSHQETGNLQWANH